MSNNLKFEGWGTSLAWWANIDYPDDVREYICDLLFNDLKLNIVRYNLGGGTNPEHPQTNMRIGALVPCLKADENGEVNLCNDKYQIKILDEAVKRGVDNVELFCNSPPWWMTISGKTSGHIKKAHNNIDKNLLDNFTSYLLECAEILNQEYPNKIKSISPFNEPSSPFWTADNGQEGCFWSYNIRKQCIEKLSEKLKDVKTNDNLQQIKITSADSFCSGQEFLWYFFSPKNIIDKVNIHGYNLSQFSKYKLYVEDLDTWRYFLRYMNNNKPLWMSEYGLNGGSDTNSELQSALSLSKTILRDFKTLKPQAWIYWQVIENSNPGSWGLIDVPFNTIDCKKENIKIKKIFYALKHFTNTLKKGDSYSTISENVLKVVNENKIGYIIVNDSPDSFSFTFCEELKNINIEYIKMYKTDLNSDYEEIDISNRTWCIPYIFASKILKISPYSIMSITIDINLIKSYSNVIKSHLLLNE